MNPDRPLLYIFPLLWKHRLFLTIVTLVTGALATLVMLLKPDYYTSTALFYPVNNTFMGPINDLNAQSLGVYGTDKDVDRLLSIAKSQQLETYIIDKFDLAQHYDITGETPKAKSKVNKKLRELYTIHKTEYDALQVSVEDIDPVMAKNIAGEIVSYIDVQSVKIVKGSQVSVLATLKKSLMEKQKRLGVLTDSLKNMRQRYRIYDTKSQGEVMATLEIKDHRNPLVQKMISDYNTGIDDVMKLEVTVKEMNKSLVYQEIELNTVQNNYTKQSSGLHIIENAILPMAKSRPRRSLYILGAIVFMFGITCLYILIREQIQRITANGQKSL